MKKITSLLLCMVLLLAMLPVGVSAEGSCMEAAVTVSDEGFVTVMVTGRQPAANARLTVEFDSDYLTYVGYETAFAVHSARAEEEKLTIGLANASNGPVSEGEELVNLTFEMTGRWDKTDITVTAVMYGGRQVDESVTVTAIGGGYRFEDVTAGQWYYEAVDYMAAEGYILGISQSHFGPALNMNRASFVTLLGRLAGVPKEQVQTQFVDVPADSFYSGYVAWAAKNGITTGVDATHFDPTGSVSRAQMVAFLYRYAKSVDPDRTVGDAQQILGAFADGQDVLAYDWMAESFAWAVENGIINGMDGKLNPYGLTNRAQVAVMLYRFFFEA